MLSFVQHKTPGALTGVLAWAVAKLFFDLAFLCPSLLRAVGCVFVRSADGFYD